MLGVGNDQLVCDLCEPPASSIIPNSTRAGHVAAELLLRGQNHLGLGIPDDEPGSPAGNHLVVRIGESAHNLVGRKYRIGFSRRRIESLIGETFEQPAEPCFTSDSATSFT